MPRLPAAMARLPSSRPLTASSRRTSASRIRQSNGWAAAPTWAAVLVSAFEHCAPGTGLVAPAATIIAIWRSTMKRSTERILTTHVGSLIRPPELLEFIRARQSGQAYDEDAYQSCLTESVAEVVRQQAEAGVDVVSDGEFG